MSRSPKNTIDYFPHNCQHKKTLKLLESRYNKGVGYSFWFKLLELLGQTPDHFIDCKNEFDKLWLVEYCLGSPDAETVQLSIQILDFCARLNAIDFELWNNDRIIWSQNFVDNLKGVYEKRKNTIPTKPTTTGNPSQITIPVRNESTSNDSGNENRQSKVKETKQKEITNVEKSKKMDLFDVAWNLYKKKQDRKKALSLWLKLDIETMNEIIRVIPFYVKSTPDVTKRKMFKTYLFNESWTNEIDTSRGTTQRIPDGFKYECFSCGGTYIFKEQGYHRCKNNECQVENRTTGEQLGYALDYIGPVYKEKR